MNTISILYVDDEPLNLLLFSNIFRKSYNVITGNSGEEGLKILNENAEIKIVFSDMKMQGMSGLEFIKEAKTNFPNLVFFIITGYGITDEIAKAIEDKLIKGYFGKPVDIEEIRKAIEEILY